MSYREIVTYSMGVCSAYIACRLQETCQRPLCVFSDTKAEDEDTYRFGQEVAAQWGVETDEASDGRHLWDFFREQHLIPARQIPACSIAMKIKPFEAWLDRFVESGGTGRVAVGYEAEEWDRIEGRLKHWKRKEVSLWFPLVEWGVSKAQCFGFFLERGITPPRIYRHMNHANCLPCKNFRMNDWVALRHHYPEKFDAAQALEEEMGVTWMQDGTALRAVPVYEPQKRGRARKLTMTAPAFNFEMGCDACGVD
jgi:hypothetical protein